MLDIFKKRKKIRDVSVKENTYILIVLYIILKYVNAFIIHILIFLYPLFFW